MNGRASTVAVITGGAKGIGYATAEALLAKGGAVFLGDIDIPAGYQAVERLRRQFNTSNCFFLPTDVTDEGSLARLVDFAVQTTGRLDAMINNAGAGGSLARLVETTAESWDQTFRLLCRAVFLGTQFATRVFLREQIAGSIVNVASLAGLSGGAGGAAYSAAKAAVINFTRAAATELGAYGIRCNCVCPGAIDTPLMRRDGGNEELKAAAEATQPLRMLGEPAHVAAAIAFLCSPDAAFITGESLVVDGGATAAGPNIYSGWHPLGKAIAANIQTQHAADGPPPGNGTNADRGSLPKSWSNEFQFSSSELFPTAGDPKTRRTVLITGASRGLGYALTRKLAEMGHKVVGCCRSAERVAELQREFGDSHGFRAVDVACDKSVHAWAQELAEELDCVPDILVSNAATFHEGKQLWRLEPDEVERVIQTNLMGPMNLARRFLPYMLKRRSGIIVNFSSGWGREVDQRVSAYAASKWGIEGMTKSLATELPPGMAAVTLHPGIIASEGLQRRFGEDAARYPTPEVWAEFAAPFLLSISPADNGRGLTVPGMGIYYGLRSNRPTTVGRNPRAA